MPGWFRDGFDECLDGFVIGLVVVYLWTQPEHKVSQETLTRELMSLGGQSIMVGQEGVAFYGQKATEKLTNDLFIPKFR